ncbi:uncharacterized protein P174DRAFT_214864 [Aspergillus novofumigatus IBT 16806]|uniref:Secreted protein n=1 Tax=Aspergillus novofumigatus (strain IBT 16806) TaxID=1392255 RepID=A0A2I1C5A7_ASPN1|nr:uncharacterized protein P174DRAFT_214864 [Aspergillus novofumigatus IBT 16806]PKX92860.1 hypothetical protein P174DRAFT_214864 [Aspergillus novofumigatus IBT 16806]
MIRAGDMKDGRSSCAFLRFAFGLLASVTCFQKNARSFHPCSTSYGFSCTGSASRLERQNRDVYMHKLHNVPQHSKFRKLTRLDPKNSNLGHGCSHDGRRSFGDWCIWL